MSIPLSGTHHLNLPLPLPRHRHAAWLACVGMALLNVTACHPARTGPEVQPNRKEIPSMTTSPTPASTALVTPHLDAGQVLQRTLQLIGKARSIRDFSPQQLGDNYGVPFASHEPGQHSFAEQIDRDWWYSLQIAEDIGGAPRFDVSFDQAVPSARGVSMAGICQIDFDQFGQQLQALGFSRRPNHAEHGRHVSDVFERDGMRVEVFARGESEASSGTSAHACVKMLTIR